MLSEEKYYNKIMKQDKMYLEEAKNIIDEMYQDKYKIIEENNTIYVDEVKFTNLEFASVIMLREVQSLRRKLEKQQQILQELLESSDENE